MRPYSLMDRDERLEFLLGALRIIETTSHMPHDTSVIKTAMIAIWSHARERSVINVHTHWDVDRETLIDETIRTGVTFFENLVAMANEPDRPPDITPTFLFMVRQRTLGIVDTLRDPKYRRVIAAVYEDFFEDQREQGAL